MTACSVIHVCQLTAKWLLALTAKVILGSRSHGTQTVFYCLAVVGSFRLVFGTHTYFCKLQVPTKRR
jgi:hypothetical protein